jgi:hypothetical protein
VNDPGSRDENRPRTLFLGRSRTVPGDSVLVRWRSGCTAGSHVRKRLLYAIVRLVSSAQNALHNGW